MWWSFSSIYMEYRATYTNNTAYIPNVSMLEDRVCGLCLKTEGVVCMPPNENRGCGVYVSMLEDRRCGVYQRVQ